MLGIRIKTVQMFFKSFLRFDVVIIKFSCHVLKIRS